MMKVKCAIIGWVLLAWCAATGVQAQQQSAPPADQPAADQPAAAAPDGQPMRVTVTAFEGLVQVRADEDQAWARPQVGQQLGPGAEFRTGPRSFVEFSIGEDHKIRLDRLGTVKVINAVMADGKVRTDLGMPYGQTRYNVERAGVETDARIHSPGATLAIRGTYVSLYNRPPFDILGISYWDEAFFDLDGNRIAFGGKRYAEILAKLKSAAATAKRKSSINPLGPFSGETPNEEAVRELYQYLAGFENSYFLGLQEITAFEEFLRHRDLGGDDDDDFNQGV